MKTILLGEAPPKWRMKDTETSLPFSGLSGRRFSEMLGQDVTEVFWTRNLLSEWPGESRVGSRFPRDQGKKAAVRFITSLPSEGARVILAGSRVVGALGLKDMPPLVWMSKKFRVNLRTIIVDVARVPHPSGVNHQWNDPETTGQVREFLLAEKERMNAQESN